MKFSWILTLAIVFSLSSCKVYKNDIILRFDEEFSAEDLQKSIDRAAENYVVIPGEILQVDVFTNNGERLIDPNQQFGQNNQQFQNGRQQFDYFVMNDGTIKLPIIGLQSIGGLTIYEAEELLEEAYDSFYVDSFVKIRPTNRRVTILGGFGQGGGQVVPLPNENMTILEVLGLVGGIQLGSKAREIKLVRGDINDPKVYNIDLSTISGMKQTGMIVESGDVIYTEPWRRPFRQSLNDIAPVLSLTTSITTLVLVLTR